MRANHPASPAGHPLVTIIIPTYNQASFLTQTIRSALAQDYPNLELVISDDGSRDGTKSIVESISDSRIRYVRNERNLGRVGNYRKALYEKARGDWVLNLDGDDILLDTGFIGAAVEVALGSHAPVFVFADRYERDDPFEMPPYTHDVRKAEPEYWDGTEYILSLPKPKARIHHLAVLYDRKAAMDIDFYRTDIMSSDYESIWRLALGRTIAHIPSRVAIWRRHSLNASRSGNIDAVIENFSLFSAVHAYAVRLFGTEKKSAFDGWLVRNVANRYYGSVCNQLRSGDIAALSKLNTNIRKQFPGAYRSVLFSPKLYFKGGSALIQFLLDRFKRRSR
jgi:glycosyltransferase involved in cell wall biosynthesis